MPLPSSTGAGLAIAGAGPPARRPSARGRAG